MGSAACPYCRTAFEPDDEIVACLGCATQHHAECLEENGGCTVFGCSQSPPDEPAISVSGQDLAAGSQPLPPGAAPPSFLDLSVLESNVAPPVSAPPPPPPRPAGVAPPPPMIGLQTSYVPVMTYPTFGGYAPAAPAVLDAYVPRKSRVVFVLLAIFLGAFGGHNFYAGYVKRAVIQLCITILSCFAGSLVSWIWAIVEACVVNQDDDGVSFV